MLSLGHVSTLGPEYVAALTAAITALAGLLRQEHDRRVRREGQRRTRQGDHPDADKISPAGDALPGPAISADDDR